MNMLRYSIIIYIILSIIACSSEPNNIETINEEEPISWKFAVVGDTHVTYDSDTIAEMIPYFIKDDIDLILLCGDIVQGGELTTAEELEVELKLWQEIFQPLYDSGIEIYPIRGNHEDDADNNIDVWNNFFTGDKILPQNGPTGEENLSYSFNHKNALFIGLDNYVDIHKVNQIWLDSQLETNSQPHIFVFGHEAAFKVFHSDCLDDYPTDRDTFWNSLTTAGVKSYFCGHDHFFDVTEIDDGDNNSENNIYQCLVGGGGAWIMPKYEYNGDNSDYTVNPIYHRAEHGYALVEVSGETLSDLDVEITWKARVDNDSVVIYPPTLNVINYKATPN